MRIWLLSQENNTPRHYVILAIWGIIAGLAYVQAAHRYFIFPYSARSNGTKVQLGFVGTLIATAFVSMVIDYHPPVAAGITFVLFAGGSYVYKALTRKPLCPRSARRELLEIRQQNLAKLRIMEAKCGMNVPLDIQNAIEHELREIERLSGEAS